MGQLQNTRNLLHHETDFNIRAKKLVACASLQRPITNQVLNPIHLFEFGKNEITGVTYIHQMLRKFHYFSKPGLPIHQNLKELEKNASSFNMEMRRL